MNGRIRQLRGVRRGEQHHTTIVLYIYIEPLFLDNTYAHMPCSPFPVSPSPLPRPLPKSPVSSSQPPGRPHLSPATIYGQPQQAPTDTPFFWLQASVRSPLLRPLSLSSSLALPNYHNPLHFSYQWHRLHHHIIFRPPAMPRCPSALSALSNCSTFFLCFPCRCSTSARWRCLLSAINDSPVTYPSCWHHPTTATRLSHPPPPLTLID